MANICDQVLPITLDLYQRIRSTGYTENGKLPIITAGADPGLPLGGFYYSKCMRSMREFLKPRPLSRKTCPFFMHICQSDRAITATGQ